MVNEMVTLRVMVFSFDAAFFSGVASGETEGSVADADEDGEVDSDADSAVSRGGTSSADWVSVSPVADELLPPKKPFNLPAKTNQPLYPQSSGKDYKPAMLSSLISPYAMASVTETNPDSERVNVAFTTGSMAPRSVKLPRASATPVISASRIRVGNPLDQNH